MRRSIIRSFVRSFVRKILPDAPPTYAEEFSHLRDRFSNLLLIDGSRLDRIAHRLKILWKEKAVVLPGCLTAVYDVSRGLAVQLSFSADAAESEFNRALLAFEQVEKGSLVVGDRLYCSGKLFRFLNERGLFGLFLRTKTMKLEEVEQLSVAQEDGVVVEDWLVRNGTGGNAVDLRALGFWKALRKVYPKARQQRCRVHKTANVLDKMPKSVQPDAKKKIHEIYNAETRKEAEKSFDLFIELYEDRYPKATKCLKKDRESLPAFCDFPKEHWLHVRTTNPIESTFATVRLRTYKTKRCGSVDACLAMVFKLVESAAKGWRRLRGSKLLADVVQGVELKDGLKNEAEEAAA